MNKQSHITRVTKLMGVVLATFMTETGDAQAADKDVVNTNANWNTAADWSGGTLPTGGDNVYIDMSADPVKTIALASTPVNPGVTEVILARIGTGTAIVNHTGGSLTVSNKFFLGNTGTPAPGTGIWNMSGDAVLNMYGLGGGLTVIGYQSGATGELNLSGNAQFVQTNQPIYVAGRVNGSGAGTTGRITLSDASKLSLNGSLVVGNVSGGTGTLTAKNTAQVTVTNGTTTVGNGAGTTGTVTLADNSIFTMAGSGAEFQIGNNSGVGSMTLNGSAVLNVTNWLAVGRLYGSGTLTINGGTINKTYTSGSYMSVGIMGSTGRLIQNGGYVSNTVSDLRIGSKWTLGPGNGTYDLNGGILETYRIVRVDTNSTGLFNFNGGTLKAATDSTTFLEGLTAVTVKSGGAVIDSNGKSITIGQSLLDGGSGGGLVKLGTGTLTLSGTNTYTGATTISNGYLRLGWAQTLPASANVTVAGGTYDLGGFTVTNGEVSLNAGWIINGTLNASALNVSGDHIIRANLAGVLTKSGSGTLQMENFSGGSNVVSGGTLKIGPAPVPSVMAESLAWFDASDAATISTNAEGQVTNWANKGSAGATLDAGQLTAGVGPFVTPNALNGRSVLTVTNTTALLTKNNTGITGGQDRTMFAVGCRKNSGNMFLAFLGYITADNIAFAISSETTAQKYFLWGAGNEITFPARANGVHEIYDFMMASSNATANLISGGVLSSQSKACTPNTASSRLYLGYRPNYVPSQGDLAEVILFNRALNAQERGDVEAYLRAKWFIAATTPPPAGDVVVNSPGVLYLSAGMHTVRSLTINGELQVRQKVYSATTLPGLIEGPGSLFTTSGAPPKGTFIRIF